MPLTGSNTSSLFPGTPLAVSLLLVLLKGMLQQGLLPASVLDTFITNVQSSTPRERLLCESSALLLNQNCEVSFKIQCAGSNGVALGFLPQIRYPALSFFN